LALFAQVTRHRHVLLQRRDVRPDLRVFANLVANLGKQLNHSVVGVIIGDTSVRVVWEHAEWLADNEISLLDI